MKFIKSNIFLFQVEIIPNVPVQQFDPILLFSGIVFTLTSQFKPIDFTTNLPYFNLDMLK